jgi:hypothetical protein
MSVTPVVTRFEFTRMTCTVGLSFVARRAKKDGQKWRRLGAFWQTFGTFWRTLAHVWHMLAPFGRAVITQNHQKSTFLAQ